jgi:hypothetical protein
MEKNWQVLMQVTGKNEWKNASSILETYSLLSTSIKQD